MHISKLVAALVIIYFFVYDYAQANRGKFTLYLHIILLASPYSQLYIPYMPLHFYWITGILLIILNKPVHLGQNNKLLLLVFFYSILLSFLGTIEYIPYQVSKPLFFYTGLIVASKTNSAKFLVLVILVSSLPIISQVLPEFLPILNFFTISSLRVLVATHYQLGIAGSTLVILISGVIVYYPRHTTMISYIVLIVFIGITFLSGGRTQTFSMLVCMIIIFKFSKHILIIGCILYALFSFVVEIPEFSFALERYSRITASSTPGDLSEISFRAEQQEWAFGEIKRKPLLGYGYNSWLANRGAFSSNRVVTVLYPHNGYLLILYESGLFGFSIFIICVFSGAKIAFMKKQNFTSVIASSIIILYLIIGISHDVLARFNLLWLYVGIATANLSKPLGSEKSVFR